MSSLCRFNGMVIRIYYEYMRTRHNHPHIHIWLGNQSILTINVLNLELIQGKWSDLGSAKRVKLLKKWIKQYQPDLIRAWDTISIGGTPDTIPPPKGSSP